MLNTELLLKSPDTSQRMLRWTGERCSRSLPCSPRLSAWSRAPCGHFSAPPLRPSLHQALPRAATSSRKSTPASPCHSPHSSLSVVFVFPPVKPRRIEEQVGLYSGIQDRLLMHRIKHCGGLP